MIGVIPGILTQSSDRCKRARTVLTPPAVTDFSDERCHYPGLAKRYREGHKTITDFCLILDSKYCRASLSSLKRSGLSCRSEWTGCAKVAHCELILPEA